MDAYYFIFEVEPQPENQMIAHVSRAVVHVWVLSTQLSAAREIALEALQSESWKVTGEKEGYLPAPEQIEGLEAEELSNYQTAQTKGIHTMFYYWHRSE